MTTTINGYPVLQAHPTPGSGATRSGRVILVDRGEDERGPRYVTAWHADGDSGWWQGNYIDDFVDAVTDFARRCRRGW